MSTSDTNLVRDNFWGDSTSIGSPQPSRYNSQHRKKRYRRQLMSMLRRQHIERIAEEDVFSCKEGQASPPDSLRSSAPGVFSQLSEGRSFYNNVKRRDLLALIPFILLLLVVIFFVGCSASNSVERTTVIEESGNAYSPDGNYRRSQETTTQRSVESDEGCGGVLSCAVDTIGTVVAFPFKAIGALIGVIF